MMLDVSMARVVRSSEVGGQGLLQILWHYCSKIDRMIKFAHLSIIKARTPIVYSVNEVHQSFENSLYQKMLTHKDKLPLDLSR
jgi:hypothetical protein